ncbi:MAG TPA: anaerobic sulfatase-maturation protein [Bacteroidales bacterium]|nr:anaerobic sulfatase-maturation protein [Bacteroidales bacterium]
MDILFSDALKLRRPDAFHVMLKPAGPSCNLDCTYCYYIEKRNLFPSVSELKMTDELLENYTRQFIDAHQVPVVTFTWQGGEPTLMGIDFFKKALDYQKKYGGGKNIENAFQTNGTRLNDEWCEFLKDNNFLVGISIDGEEHNHDRFRKTASGGATFKRAMRGIELLHKHKVEFNTLSCVTSYNAHYALETYRFLKKIGSGFIQFLPVVERETNPQENSGLKLASPLSPGHTATDWSVRAKDFGKFLITIFDEWVRNDVARYYVQIFDSTLANYVGEMPGICVFSETCGDALVMEHNGNLYTCDHFVFPEYYLGNIAETPMIEMVRSQRQFDFGINKRNSLPAYCLRCDVRYACHGECPKHRFILTPDGKPGLNYLCEGYKDFFHHVEPYMDFMAKELKNKRPPANVMQWIRNRENQVIRKPQPERNDPCPCGSGKKFKNCCAGKPLFNF